VNGENAAMKDIHSMPEDGINKGTEELFLTSDKIAITGKTWQQIRKKGTEELFPRGVILHRSKRIESGKARACEMTIISLPEQNPFS
jgi:hypothetical protein